MDILGYKKAYFKLIHHFNVFPSYYLHTSWLTSEDWALLGHYTVITSRRAQRRLSASLLKKLKYAYHYDFNTPQQRLALLDFNRLVRLIYYVGLTQCGKLIHGIIEKEKVVALQETLGKHLFRFALERAHLFTGQPAACTITFNTVKQFNQDLVTVGKTLIEKCLDGEPVALTNRFRLKMPKPVPWNFRRNVSPEQKEQAWHFLAKLIKFEMEDVWQTHFA